MYMVIINQMYHKVHKIKINKINKIMILIIINLFHSHIVLYMILKHFFLFYLDYYLNN